MNEPSVADISFTRKPDRRKKDQKKSTTEKEPWSASDSGPHLDALPERIRISSQRLAAFLNHEFADGNLAFSVGSAGFSMLRPFKFLIYHDKRFRARVKELEGVLNRLKENAPGDYDESASTHTDFIKRDWQGLQYSLSELTGILADCHCLFEFMDKQLYPEQARLAAGPETVRFSDLFFLFPRGSLVYVKDSGIPQKVWRVMQASGGRRSMAEPEEGLHYRFPFTSFQLECYYLDHNGKTFVKIQKRFQIMDFDGTLPVKSLSVVPFIVAERDLELINREALIQRGKQFVECTGKVSHLDYSGRSQNMTPNGQKLTELAEGAKSSLCFSERIEGEVMVDFSRALQEVPGWKMESSEFHFSTTTRHETGNETGIDDDKRWENALTDEFFEMEEHKWRAWDRGNEVPSEEEDLLLLPDRIFAFVLPSRRWACLQIGKGPDGKDQLRPRTPEDNPWEKLQLPPGHKELVQSLILSHFAQSHSSTVHFDLLRNKGNGVIILLHGVPGVGKTSTAECAAVSTNRPLLPITCGDLGLSPGEVEDKLKEVFRLAQDWGCVMLLDEADVFLAQRSVTDTTRNALVSVFLRTLEYYEGILFLTTNRVGVFDEAFRSRIHMSLYYPSLERMQTMRIWERHIQEAAKAGIEVDNDSLVDFADMIYETQKNSASGAVWNGRQIRNAFQSALALAAFHSHGGPVKLERRFFENVFRVSDQFSSYIWTTKNYQSDADRNRLGMVRRDDFNYQSMSTGQFALQQQRQQQRQPGILQSTYGQRMPPSPSNIGLQRPQPQADPMAGLASYPVHAQRLDNIQAAAMRQPSIQPPEQEYQHVASTTPRHVTPDPLYTNQTISRGNQLLQYSNTGALYDTADPELRVPSTRQTGFTPPPPMAPQGGHY
ncbi:hypothetical protein N7456_001007 [Penicillium angulare]|uniref:AAA+ ATPase domain-containing protein n=1 Tax=Penicillium angulare TaxID=116970 RepID=A0A9W9KSS2_9EURO|nr:hypothetical protein N7456_001007 [Penicillium angulare]